MSTRPFVVAVAAPIGGGKSTLTQALARSLGESSVLAFDDYETASAQSVVSLADWLQQGADFDALEAPGLLEDLRVLRAGGSVRCRSSNQVWQAQQHLLFEMPLGYGWTPGTELIDRLIWIDVPPDLALARRIREITTDVLAQDAQRARQGLAWLNDYLSHYEHVIHKVLAVQRERVRQRADLILDGTQSLANMVSQVEHWLQQERAK